MQSRHVGEGHAAADDGHVDFVAEDLGEGEGVGAGEDGGRGRGEFVGADDCRGHHVDDGEVGVVRGDEGVRGVEGVHFGGGVGGVGVGVGA